jgi:hypothetical protein
MADTWNAKRLRHERDYEARLDREMGDLARRIGVFVRRQAGADGTIQNTQRAKNLLKQEAWRQVKDYFIGSGADALDGARPQSAYARLLTEGIEGAIRIQVERQVAIVRKYADPVVERFLTQPGRRQGVREIGDRRPGYDPFHLFVYGNNPYQLSDRVWQTAIDVRARIDALLDYEISQGTSAVDIADRLVGFLNPVEAGRVTNKPYGQVGSYSARRLARTEITAAAGRSAINAAIINPYVTYLKWTLSPSHPKIDICDSHAGGGARGDGTYDPRDFPAYPAHPHCLCAVIPVVTESPAAVTRRLRAEIEELAGGRTGGSARPVESLRGAFNVDWLVGAIMFGWISGIMEQVE